MLEFKKVTEEHIYELSKFASGIVKEHYDPIIGAEQNDYMINMFQSPEAIKNQLSEGWRYYILLKNGEKAGFTAFYPKMGKMYIGKLYVDKSFRGQHIAKETVKFIENQTKQDGMSNIFLNVNRYNNDSISAYEHLGFVKIKEEKNPIGHGYFMDDFVMEKSV